MRFSELLRVRLRCFELCGSSEGPSPLRIDPFNASGGWRSVSMPWMRLHHALNAKIRGEQHCRLERVRTKRTLVCLYLEKAVSKLNSLLLEVHKTRVMRKQTAAGLLQNPGDRAGVANSSNDC